MKDDYLWDKTGEDSEIKQLETALSAFRFKEESAPQIPLKILPFEKQKAAPKVFPVFRALAACLTAAFVLIGVWLIEMRPEIDTAKNQPEEVSFKKIKTENITQIDQAVGFPTPDDRIKNEKKILRTSSKTGNLKSQKSIYRPAAKPRWIKKTKPAVSLTDEEKEAYEKLMLALSITGSKLRIVKEKVQNLEGQTAIHTENNSNTRKK